MNSDKKSGCHSKMAGDTSNMLGLLLFIHIFAAVVCKDCSNLCKCYMWNGLRKADCVDKGLVNIETETSVQVEVLDLSHNYISSLDDYRLQNLGLTEIRSFSLHNNKISSVGLHAFASLKKLKVIDLSTNYLQYLHPKTFEENPELHILNLSKNKFGVIHKGPFLEASSLRDLDISRCQFGSIEIDIFSKLPSLKRLNLSENHLIRVPIDAVANLSNLKMLDLSKNPWTCDGDMKVLQIWLQQRGILDTTKCHSEGKSANIVLSTMENDKPPEYNEEDMWFEADEIDRGGKFDDDEDDVVNEPVETDILGLINQIPSVWALAIGFQVGAMLSIFGMYIWLRSPALFKRRPRVNLRSMRPSEDSDILWTELQTPYCPDTPPPPYRVVQQSVP